MDDFEISTPVYLVDGILESGKTSFLNFTIRQDYFQVDGTTLLISCEEGEEEYDEKDLLKYHTVLETIEEPEDLTLSTLRAFEKKYRPERVIIEYNPLWGVNKLRAMEMPPGWGICQEIVIIDGGSYEIYRNNMQSVFTEMVQDADMVILLHREDMYNPDSERVGEADMIIAKHRGGPTRTIPLAFSGKYSRFNNMANEAPPQY